MLKILVWEKSGFFIYYKRLKKNKSKKKWVTLNWGGRALSLDYAINTPIENTDLIDRFNNEHIKRVYIAYLP